MLGPEVAQRIGEEVEVRGVRFGNEIEISGRTDDSVCGDRDAANDDVGDTGVVERRDDPLRSESRHLAGGACPRRTATRLDWPRSRAPLVRTVSSRGDD